MLAREPNYCLNNLWYFMVYLYSAEWEFFFFFLFLGSKVVSQESYKGKG